MAEGNQDELMVVAAVLYYEDGLTHEAIAHRLRLSRVAVTRLLQRARREGIVHIKVTKPLPVQYNLATQIQSLFGLKHVLVVKTRSDLDETLDDIGATAAHHLLDVIFPHCRLGVGWSTTLRHMAPHLVAPRRHIPIVINELIGSLASSSNPYNISWQLAQTLNAPVETLAVPAVVLNQQTRAALLRDQSVHCALEHTRQCDIAVVGLGDVGPNCTMIRTGYMTAEQMATVRDRGGVGDVLSRFYNTNGEHVPTPIDAAIMSLSLQDFQRIPYIIALAAGPSKAEVILGALRGKMCHCLVTDTATAQQTLALAAQQQVLIEQARALA